MTVRIHELYQDMQQVLSTSMNLARKHITHKGSQGTATEQQWIEFLTEHLPGRYCARGAFVIDSEGAVSQQLDLVVYDRQYSPVIMDRGGVQYIPAESVYAVFEVKPDLTLTYVRYAGEKVASVRRLKRTSARVVHAGGEIATPKPPFRVLGGILTTSSGWVGPLGEPLRSALHELSEDEQLDLGCTLESGAFEARWDASTLSGLDAVDQDEALLWFYFRLLHRLSALGTVPAIDFNAYAKHAGATRSLL